MLEVVVSVEEGKRKLETLPEEEAVDIEEVPKVDIKPPNGIVSGSTVSFIFRGRVGDCLVIRASVSMQNLLGQITTVTERFLTATVLCPNKVIQCFCVPPCLPG